MAKKMFEVEIRNNGPKGYETAVSLRMPATWSEFHDALQKARIKDGRSCGNELLYVGYDGLQRGMIGRNINLYDLNLLAQRLTALTPEENTGMETLLAMEWSRHRGSVSLEHLINLTYNTDVCCLAPQVSNFQELGAFLYESEMLSKEAMALLDTTEEGSEFRASLLKLMAEQHKEDHGGVFTKRGYAELGGEIKPIYMYQPGETIYFHRSGAPVVLEVRKGFFNDPQYDNDNTAILNLPAIDKDIWQAVEAVDAASVEECVFRCTDCLIPSLRDAIDEALEDGGLDQVREFAGQLAQKERTWGAAEFIRYKALLAASGQPSLGNAAQLLEEAEQYELLPEVAETWDYVELMAREKYPDLPPELFQTPQAANVGRTMLEEGNATITDYGLLRRKDGQPLPSFTQEHQSEEVSSPQMVGM
ncbi:hypothetical protein [Flavonifractor plautii]|uniref:hypothetical protein n=1 Tax=Flavonifractor plautii TaxID=292800 RepID=UPI0034BBA0B2